MSKVITINIPNRDKYNETSIYDIKDLQGDLKEYSKEDLEKLKNELINEGFCFPLMLWKKDNDFYSVDGKHRCLALMSLKEDGYIIPEYLPYIEIQADDERQAVKRILAANSHYATITQTGFDNLIQKFDIKIDEIKDIKINNILIDCEINIIEIEGLNNTDQKSKYTPNNCHIQLGAIMLNIFEEKQRKYNKNGFSILFQKKNVTEDEIELIYSKIGAICEILSYRG